MMLVSSPDKAESLVHGERGARKGSIDSSSSKESIQPLVLDSTGDERQGIASADNRIQGRATASGCSSIGSSRSQTSPRQQVGAQKIVSFEDADEQRSSAHEAQYVTVSSILSRSGHAFHPSSIRDESTRRGLDSNSQISFENRDNSDSWMPRRRASNGSALEALGVLFLNRDSSGRVSNLSAARVNNDGQLKGRKGGGRSVGSELSFLSRTWLRNVNESVERLGIKMPKRNEDGQTIAQRRARKQAHDGTSNRESEPGTDGFVTVGTSASYPTFEIGHICNARGDGHANHLDDSRTTPPNAPSISGRLDSEPSPLLMGADHADSHRQAPLTEPGAVFGPGSAFTFLDPPDAPPSPIGMPGAWAAGGRGWAHDPFEEGALLLPPPLLDDQGSDAKSFEGLLGVRRMREQELARSKLEILRARNRPAHRVGMLTAVSNFVKAARAADQATKAQSRRKYLTRRHTEPARSPNCAKDGVFRTDQKVAQVKRESLTHHVSYTDRDITAQDMRRGPSASRSSIDSSRQLPTLYEAAPLDIDTIGFNTGDVDQGDEVLRPRKPSISATLPSLPPSPWTPYDNALVDKDDHALLSQLGMTPISGPPGTPRLVPMYLEMTSAKRRGSKTISPIPVSPRFKAIASSEEHGLADPSPFILSPTFSPFASAQSTLPRIRSNSQHKVAEVDTLDLSSARLTPLELLKEPNFRALGSQSPRREKQVSERPEASGPKADQHPPRRSLLLWFFLGNLGMTLPRGTSESPQAAANSGSSLPHEVFSATTCAISHLYGFAIFVFAHLFDLSYSFLETLSTTLWLAKWLFLNLTGRTVLSQCVADSYRIVRREWESVSREDHEDRGTKRKRRLRLKAGQEDAGKETLRFRGLSRWQVIKGLVELCCLQDVTRARFLREGAGLIEIPKPRRGASHSSMVARPDIVDIGNAYPWRKLNKGSLDGDHCAADDNSDDEESQSSDDEMIVTRQSQDILEFVKTPRAEPRGYFTSTDNVEAEDRKASVMAEKSNKRRRTRRPASSDREMLKIIKWASRLSISAYGLHVTLVDLPPTFTPSGNRFSRQTFAHLSRLHHEDVLHADIQALDSVDYSPTFYLVRDLARRVIAVSVRGTQSLQDIIVDLDMVVEELELSEDSVDAGESKDTKDKYYCHAGILRAAKSLLARDSRLFKTLFDALESNPDFDIVFTGHSLGGAIASTIVLLLSRFETSDGTNGSWLTHEHSGLPSGRRIRAVTFAHPATVSANLAERSVLGDPPLILTVTLGHDFIPRCGHGQAREVRRVLGALSRVRRRKRKANDRLLRRRIDTKEDVNEAGSRTGDEPVSTGNGQDSRIHIVTSWWRWRSIRKKGDAATSDELQEKRRIEDALWRLRCDVENDLYAAVKQRSKTTIPPSPWIGPAQRNSAPLHQLAARRQALDAITMANEEEISGQAGRGLLVPAGRSLWLHDDKIYAVASPLSFYGMPDFHAQMFIHHFPSAYEDALESL